MAKENKTKLGISACLLGEKVRYDGGHKLDAYLKNTLGRFVEFVPVCPEVECGLPVPREAMHLTGSPENPKLVTVRTGRDMTDKMNSWASGWVKELEREDLCGFIFKMKSPSSGMRNVKVYDKNGIPNRRGIGLFAKAFMEHFPDIPVEDDGRLHDPGIRENFVERVFTCRRWKELNKSRKSRKSIIDFHTSHKMTILSHSPKLLREMGNLVGTSKELGLDELYGRYFALLKEALNLRATVRKNTNVLQHIAGYFKKALAPEEKKELSELIMSYHEGHVPLIVPVTLINHHVAKHGPDFLKVQHYLHPHPTELQLRNHV